MKSTLAIYNKFFEDVFKTRELLNNITFEDGRITAIHDCVIKIGTLFHVPKKKEH